MEQQAWCALTEGSCPVYGTHTMLRVPLSGDASCTAQGQRLPSAALGPDAIQKAIPSDRKQSVVTQQRIIPSQPLPVGTL